ncbi:hypothetical protein B0H16DRAFT_1715931 [Mycena metata]|uniref:Uncharacterized protein n=1 Tax=Mycena metata TaxID=1033252 RepID=A0AAD7NNV2_9AGAR|nr:hypothetical protein B0H16DRAFT_1715931 [Mycena metata]
MADATPLETANALNYAEDRAFKQLALNGAPLNTFLQNWVDRYVPGPPMPASALDEKSLMLRSLGIPVNPRPKPPGYIVGAAVKERVAARALITARERRAAEERAFMRREHVNHDEPSIFYSLYIQVSVGFPANPRQRPAGYIAGAAVRERVTARCIARAEQAAKEARVRAREKVEAQRQREAEAQRLREAGAANAAELIQMRLAGEQRNLGRVRQLA